MIRIMYDLQIGENMVINNKGQLHHLCNVIKVKMNEDIYLIKNNQVVHTKISSISKNEIVLRYIGETFENNELPINVTLGFAPLKGDNTQLVIQKAVELGVAHIDLLNFKRNIIKFDQKSINKKQEKFDKIIEGACNQSRRNIVPAIKLNQNINLQYLNMFDLILVCYEDEKSNHINLHKQSIKNAKNILIVIGPEGGFEKTEIDQLIKYNANVITLGKRILRAETASITSLSIVAGILEGENENSN